MSAFPLPPARGDELPDNPRNNMLFFLDVPNNSDPPRGWYMAMVGFSGGTDWTFLGVTLQDQGDQVRPVEVVDQLRFEIGH